MTAVAELRIELRTTTHVQPDPPRRRLAALGLFARAITDRLRLTRWPRCPYCGERAAPARFPWQGRSLHVAVWH